MDDETKKAPRVVRNGKVAVLVSGSYGAGWSTWGSEHLREEKMFCPKLVEAIEAGMSKAERHKLATELFPGEYAGGVSALKIEWVPEGEPIRIHEYDGAESIRSASEGCVTP